MLRELRKVFRVMCAVRCGFSSAAEPVQRQRGALPRGSLRMLDTTLSAELRVSRHVASG